MTIKRLVKLLDEIGGPKWRGYGGGARRLGHLLGATDGTRWPVYDDGGNKWTWLDQPVALAVIERHLTEWLDSHKSDDPHWSEAVRCSTALENDDVK